MSLRKNNVNKSLTTFNILLTKHVLYLLMLKFDPKTKNEELYEFILEMYLEFDSCEDDKLLETMYEEWMGKTYLPDFDVFDKALNNQATKYSQFRNYIVNYQKSL